MSTQQDTQPTALFGLTARQAADRLREEGYNELPAQGRHGIVRMVWEVAHEPMFLLLVAGGAVYALLGDLTEALALLASVFIIIGITLYQERRTERALEALRDLSSPRALVIRDGAQQRIAGREVVRGDRVLLAEGDRVPADAVLRWAVNLSVDESLLTGESAPVRKVASSATPSVAEPSESASLVVAPPGGDDQPFVYSGTLVTQGRGLAETLATGPRSAMGKIGQALQEVQVEQTPLQRETGRLVWILAVWGVALCAALVVGYGLLRGQWLEGVLAGIALAMSVLPEEFPVVLTVFLALGAWRIAQQRVLTRRAPSVETLGSATVLCVDKTGTLTQNRMRVRRLFAQDTIWGLSAEDMPALPTTFHLLTEFGALASQRDPVDPMDKAIVDLANGAAPQWELQYTGWTSVREYPLTSSLLAVTQVWASPQEERILVASKGAPEAIAHLCRLSESERVAVFTHVAAMVGDGLRVLGVARAQLDAGPPPENPEAFAFEFVGLIGLADPVRPEAPAAVQECYGAGVRVVMITGDYPGTAQAIARQIGLHDPDRYITGPMLDAMDDPELREQVGATNVYARMVPEHKLRLVEALKARGDVVAMTGDGVNDAPALKAANIGIAMGGRGTDVAREAAALVLLDDNFSSIVHAVRMGRRIFDNLRKAMSYVLAIHVPIAGMALLPVLFGWPLVLAPVQIVFLELIIDPASSIVYEAEPEEADVMRRPPRDPHAPFFTRAMVGISLLEGFGMFAVVLTIFRLTLGFGASEGVARALTFMTLVLANLALVVTTRSRTRSLLATLRQPNRALWWVVGGALTLLAMALWIPFMRDLFGFAPLPPWSLLLGLATATVTLLWFEGIKFVYAHWKPQPRHPTSRLQSSR